MTSWDTARMNTNNVEASLSTENRAESRSAQTCPSVKLLCAPIVKQTHFVGFLVGVLMIQSGHIIPYSLVPTRTQAMGIDKTLGATLVSIMGVSSGCARALFGYIGDFGSLNRVIACGLSGLVAGLLTTLSTFLVDYMQMAIYAGVLGITSGTADQIFRTKCPTSYILLHALTRSLSTQKRSAMTRGGFRGVHTPMPSLKTISRLNPTKNNKYVVYMRAVGVKQLWNDNKTFMGLHSPPPPASLLNTPLLTICMLNRNY